MGVRRTRLGVEVVAVVPDRDQPEVVDGREGGGAGADDDPAPPAGDRQELAVAPGRPGSGGQDDVVTGPEHLGQGRVEPGDVTVVGNAQHAAPARVEGGRRRLGEEPRPGLPRQGRPDRAWRASAGEVGEERAGGRVGTPGLRGRLRSTVSGSSGTDGFFSVVA